MTKKLEFRNGLVFNSEKTQFYMFAVNIFMLIFNNLLKNESTQKVKSILIESTQIDAKIFAKKLKRYKDKKVIIKKFLDIINDFGYGEIKLKFSNEDKLIFFIKKSFLSSSYKNIFSKTPKVIPEIIICGYLKYFLEEIYSKKINYSISTKNDDSIYFEFKLGKQISNKSNLDYQYQIVNNTSLSNILKKVIINKHIKIEKGIFNIWGTYALIFPYFFLIELFSKLDFNKYNLFFEDLGSIQAKTATEILIKKFGYNKNKIFKSTLEQSEILGGGKIIFNLKENQKIEIKNNLTNYFSKYYTMDKIKLLKKYNLYLVKGAFEFSYNKQTKIKINNKNYNLQIIKNIRNLSEKEKEIYNILNIKTMSIKSS